MRVHKRVYKHTCLRDEGQSLTGVSLLQVALRRENRPFRVHRRSDSEIARDQFDRNDGTDAFATADPRLDDADIGVRDVADDFSEK